MIGRGEAWRSLVAAVATANTRCQRLQATAAATYATRASLRGSSSLREHKTGSEFQLARQPTSMIEAVHTIRAPLAELVDAPDSKSGSERSAGSIPARGTTYTISSSPGSRECCGCAVSPQQPHRLQAAVICSKGSQANGRLQEMTWPPLFRPPTHGVMPSMLLR